jgi:hypothetical protein
LKLYDSAKLALNNIHEFVKGQGYTVSVFRLKTNKQVLPTMRKMWLQYAKGNDYTKTIRKRLTSSYMTSCSFMLILTYIVVRWRVEVQDPSYNHQAFAHARALPHY